MRRDDLEPGILTVFRFFASLQFSLYFIEFFRSFHHTLLGVPLEQPARSSVHETVGWLIHMAFGMPYQFDRYYAYVLFNFATATLMMIYLWWGKIRQITGRAFLPLVLVLASLSPLIADTLKFLEIYRYTSLDTRILVEAWQSALLLFVPMVILAWQYGIFMVVIFCAGTMILDLFSKLVFIRYDTEYFIPLVGLIFMRSAIYVILGFIVARLSAAQKGQRRELALANQRLAMHASTVEQLTISRERNRLAHELHDTLAHTLSGIAVQLEAALSTWGEESQRTYGMVEQALTATRSGLTETRRALRALRASPLEDLGLAMALRSLAVSAAERGAFSISLSLPEELLGFSAQVEQGIFRIAQEAFENILRHAQAKKVYFEINRSATEWWMMINDDGQGFDMKDLAREDRFGLRGMRERAEMIGGRLLVESRPGSGTTIRLTMPLPDGDRPQEKRRVP
jgi:signal transduction histidine kinase